jgi:predicted nucleic acid-binding protein
VSRIPAFWDSSALVPLFLREDSSRLAASYLRDFQPVVWWGTYVEIQGAIRRIHRSGDLTDEAAKVAISRFLMLRTEWKEILPGDEIRELAVELLSTYPLHSADSMQLAASLAWCNRQPTRRTFLCGDRRLSSVADAVGFSLVEVRTP